MKVVCQLVHSLHVGGAEILASAIARKLRSSEWDFIFVCLDELGVRSESLRNERFHVETLDRRPGLDRACLQRLREILREYRVDLVHAHQYTPFFYALASRGLRRTPPLLFTEHGRFYPDIPNWKHKIFNRLLIGSQDRATAVSDSVRLAVERCEGISASRIDLIYNGIDGERFLPNRLTPEEKGDLRRSLGVAEKEKVILLTARLDPIKDHRTALLAFQKLLQTPLETPVVLLMAGDGPERRALEEYILELGLKDRARLLGERNDAADLLQIADIFLLTSVSEGTPLTLLEAMASRVPIVATHTGGIPEIISSPTTGLLAPPQNPDEIAGHLRTLLVHEDVSHEIAQNARAVYSERFTEIQMLAAYEKIYKEMLF
ncbi:MAG: glycosyltransferase [Planctomycetia bacterium]|nr:glycosyltransferase [Planctomycetia bacterium]